MYISASAQMSSSVASSTTSIQSAQNSSIADPNAGKSDSSSHSWIAGAVLGPLIAIALVAGIFYFLRRRRDKADVFHPPAGYGVLPYNNYEYEADAKAAPVSVEIVRAPSRYDEDPGLYEMTSAHPQMPRSAY